MVKKRHILIVIGILIAGLILGSFLDLQINQAIYSKNNTFCLIMASFGTYPCYASLAFIAGGLFSTAFKRKDMHIALQIVTYAIAVIAFGISIYLGSKDFPSPNGFNNPKLKIPSYLIAGVLFAGVAYLGFYVVSKGDKQKLWAVLLVMLVIFTVGLLPVSYAIKLVIHRPRYRMLVESEIVPFHNWWETCKYYKDYLDPNNPTYINGVLVTKEEFKSFPSGHSGSAAVMMMILPYLSHFFKKLKGKETMLFYIGFAWMVFMMFTRLLCGAHYLSDTCMGSLLVMLVYFVCHYFAVNKGWVFYKEEPQEETVTA